MATRLSACWASRGDRPCASAPNSHAVGPASSASSRDSSPSTVVASTRSPAACSAVTAAPASGATTTGMEKTLPADARRHLPLYGSTLCPPKITAAAPIASPMRINVPALPGSPISTPTATRRGSPANTSSRPSRGSSHTATRPAGVTVSDKAFAARSVTRLTVASCPPSRTAYRCAAASVAKISRTRPRPDAAWTRCAPSTRKRCSRRRVTCRCSLTAATTRADRSVSTGCYVFNRWTGSGSLSGGRVDIVGQRGLSDTDERRERRRIADGDFGEVLAVDLHAGGLEALDKPVVGDVVGAGRRVDPRDPQLAELALARTAVAVGVVQ